MEAACDERVFDMVELKNALLSCPVCRETAEAGQDLQLKFLQCHHTMCKSCLAQFIHGQATFRCPVCRRTMNVPVQGADGFPNNFMAQQIQDYANSCKPRNNVVKAELEPRVKCGGCKGDIGEVLHHQCLHCGYLCGTCYWKHCDNKELKHHFVFIPTSSFKEQKASAGFCSKHDFCRLDFYCRICRVTFCNFCKEFHHSGQGHLVVTVHEKAQETREEMNALLDDIANFQSRVFEVIHKVCHEEERIATESSKAKEKIQTFIRECHNILRRREMELLGSIDHRSLQMSKCLKYSKERALKLLAKIGSSMDYADQIKTENCPLAVIRDGVAWKPALQEIAQTSLDEDVEQDDYFLSVTEGDLKFDVAAFKHLVSLLGKKL